MTESDDRKQQSAALATQSSHSKVSKENGPASKSEVAAGKQSEKQMMQSEASVASTPSRLEWTKTAQASRSAQIFVMAMLIAALFAGIPFAGSFHYLANECSFAELDGSWASGYDCYDPVYNDRVPYNSVRCMLGGFILMLFVLLAFVGRVALGSLSLGSTKKGRLIGLGLDIIVTIFILISVGLVTGGGTRYSVKGVTYGVPIDRKGRTYPAADNIAIPMQATYWFALFGSIALVVFDFLAFRAAR
jgi:hypothetical protein